MPLKSGTRLGPYEIIAPLGAGGMGEVYRARDTRLGRDVAVKVLPQHLTSNPEVRARFEREARSVSSLNHPHICTLHDIGREGETDYLVMEMIEGETLSDRLSRGALPLAEVLRLGAQIATALDRAHRAGVVHRDLKPGNVMLTKSGAKLMDFGLAKAVGSAAAPSTLTESPTATTPLTADGAILGTFQYMAPEQLEGKEADARTDLFALGVVIYEMATGRRAFEGKTQASLMAAILKDEPRPIGTADAMSPPALDRLVRQCLRKDPDERIQSAHDVALQLEGIAEAGTASGQPGIEAAPARGGRERLAWGIVALASLAVLADDHLRIQLDFAAAAALTPALRARSQPRRAMRDERRMRGKGTWMAAPGFRLWIGVGAFLVACCIPSGADDGRENAPGSRSGSTAAEELLARSIAFHDPDGLWTTRPIELTWSSTGPEGKERILLDMVFTANGRSFRMNGHYQGTPIEYEVEGDEVRARVDGKTDLDEATRTKVHLDREDGLLWRNYFRFLSGLPMNLRDPGAHIDPGPERTTFMGQPVDSIRVTYDPEVGTETWAFYFHPDTARLVGCRFRKADPSMPGEYIVLDGLVEAEGLRLPKHRRWYMSEDDRYLGDDTITRLAVGDERG